MVTVKVEQGGKKSTFTIHKNIICHYSRYFAAAFNGGFQEGQTQEVLLKDVNPAIFTTFSHWLYSQQIDKTTNAMKDFVDLWLLGSRLLAPTFQNCALKWFDEKRVLLNKWPRAVFYNRAWDNTLKGSPLWEYLAALGATGTTVGEGFYEKIHKEVLVDMDMYMRKHRAKTGCKWVGKYNEGEVGQAPP